MFKELSENIFGVNIEECSKEKLEGDIAKLQERLREKLLQLNTNSDYSKYLVSADKLQSLRDSYPFLCVSSITSEDSESLSLDCSYMSMDQVPGNTQDRYSNKGVYHVTPPILDYNIMINPINNTCMFNLIANEHKYLTGKRGAKQGIDTLINRTIDEMMFNCKNSSTISEMRKLRVAIDDVRYTYLLTETETQYSHPHHNGYEKTFSNVCHGTNPFKEKLKARNLQSMDDLMVGLIYLLLWLQTSNVDDSYDTPGIPFNVFKSGRVLETCLKIYFEKFGPLLSRLHKHLEYLYPLKNDQIETEKYLRDVVYPEFEEYKEKYLKYEEPSNLEGDIFVTSGDNTYLNHILGIGIHDFNVMASGDSNGILGKMMTMYHHIHSCIIYYCCLDQSVSLGNVGIHRSSNKAFLNASICMGADFNVWNKFSENLIRSKPYFDKCLGVNKCFHEIVKAQGAEGPYYKAVEKYMMPTD